MKKLKVCQVHPGILSIPPKNWGAVELIIWNYQKSLEKLGHQCDIEYLDDINFDEYDIIHNHTGLMKAPEFSDPISFDKIAELRKFNYIFSLHDHHTVINSNIYNANKSVIQNALGCIVHGENIRKLYSEYSNVTYIPHGVDSQLFYPIEKTINSHKLLCLANNGLADNPGADRKGFLVAVEAAKILNLPITLAGPSQNKEFFKIHQNELNYDKVEYRFDLSPEEIIDLYHSHTIFLHPSNLEAGHPNLTLLEALASGLPVVGTYEGNLHLPGLLKLNTNQITPEAIVEKINAIINNYDNIAHEAINVREEFSWDKVAKSIESFYYTSLNRNQTRKSLISCYSSISKNPIGSKNKVRVNFLDGVKVDIHGGIKEKYDIRFIDKSTTETVYSTTIYENMWSEPLCKHYVDWRVIVNDKVYDIDLSGKNVLITIQSKALGDTLAWIPYAEEFRQKHNCKVSVTTFWNKLFQNVYPDLLFLEPNVSLSSYYAWYKIGCFDDDLNRHKELWNTTNLQKVASDILGLDFQPIKPKIFTPEPTTYIKKDYVAITTTSTARAKLWNNPTGWQELVNKIKEIYNLEVIVLQKEKTSLKNVIDRTNQDIYDTINDLKHAKYFVGLGSGLSWLAWALDVPTVLISGFSDPVSEFYTPYRVHNKNVCNSCYNDTSLKFDRGDWNWCPRKNNFICTSSITVEDVLSQIQKIEIYK